MSRDSDIDSIQEMERIQRGLEDFLNKEVLKQEDTEEVKEEDLTDIEYTDEEDTQEDMRERDTGSREPQFFTIGEDEYLEDWDSPKRRKKSVETVLEKKNAGTKNSGAKRTNSKNSDGKNVGGASRTKKESGKGKQVEKKSKKKKKSKFKRFLITIVVLALLVAAGWYYLVGKVYTQMNYGEIESVTAEPMKEEGVTNILLIGNDSRQNGEDGRSDAMILVSISDKTKKIYMTSLLRDMYVEIPGYKGNRLNAAYSYGGPELLMETIELNLDINVNRYVSVNFESFAALVDAVGGVDLELTSEEVEYVNAYLWEYNILTNRPEGTDYMDTSLSGMVHLNGPQALAYTRNRYIGTDFGRTERQRKVLAAIIDNAPRALITNPKTLMDELLPNLTTNLTQTEMFRLSLMAEKLLTYDLVQSSVPIEGSYSNATIRGMSVLEVDFEANKQYLKENIYGEGVQTAVE